MKKLLLLMFASLISAWLMAGTLRVDPASGGGFENSTNTFPANGWTVLNGAYNMWYVGATPVPSDGSFCAFSGTSSSSWVGTANACVNHFYQDITFNTETSLDISFKYKITAPDGDYDNLRVYLISTATTPVAGTVLGSGQIGVSYNLAATWTTVSLTGINAASLGTSARLVFSWKGDGVSPHAAVAVDYISVTSNTPPPPLSGVYTIDPAGSGASNFTTFTAAINALNGRGISGSVTFNVKAGATFNENPPAITATGTSLYPITFQKDGLAANPKIVPVGVSTSADFGVCISGGDYITWDGIDINASAATSTTTAIEYGFLIRNGSATNGAQYNTVKNCAITLNKNYIYSSGGYGSCIYSSVSSTQGGVTPTNATGANSYNKFYNLTLQNAQNGLYLYGNTSYPDLAIEVGVAGTGCQTTQNIINNMGGVYTFAGAYGVYTYGLSGVKIFNNKISNITGEHSASAGIMLAAFAGTCEVYNNEVSALTVAGSTSTAYRAVGIEIQNSTGTPTARVYTNRIFGITTAFTGSATATMYVYGIYCNNTVAATVADIDNNNVYLTATGTPLYSSTCFAIGNSAIAVHHVRGNIFYNNFPAQGATAKHVCWYSTSATAIGGAGSVSNYNDLYIGQDVGTSGHIARGNTTNYNTLANWQAIAATPDLGSVSGNPVYTTDLHASWSGLNAAPGFTTQSWVTTDMDCEDRSLNTPSDIGADAFVILDQTSKAENPASQIAAGSIASTTTTPIAAVEMFKFNIHDLASGDGQPTRVNTIVIKNANPANSADWTKNIAGVVLTDITGAPVVVTTGTPVISNTQISIPVSTGNLVVADGATAVISMSVYLKSSGTVEDGKNIQFTISQTGHGWAAAASGSVFAADFGSSITSNIFNISVTATNLSFDPVKPPANVLVNSNFNVTVNATDANGNIDIDNSSSITLSKNSGAGMLSSATGLSQSLINGSFSWTDVKYSAIEIFKVQATSTLLTTAVSGDISCTNEVQIGTGTVSSQTYPFDVYYGYSRNAALYTSAEIGAYKVIEQLAWQIAIAQTTVCPVKIYLKKTTATTVASDTWANMIAGATLVYDGSVTFTPLGWFAIPLSNPFNYDSDNLLVLTEGNYGGGGISTYPTFFYSTAVSMNASAHTDNTPPATSLTVGSSRPNIKLLFQLPMQYVSSTTSQTIVAPVLPGSVNQQVIGLQIVTNGSASPLSASSFVLSSTGSTDPGIDIQNAKLWSTGQSAIFATTTQVGNTYNGPWGSFNINTGGNMPFLLANGTNYLWLTYDISGAATIGDVVDAQFNQITIGADSYTPSIQDPAGNRMIKGPISGVKTIGATGADYPSLTGATGLFAEINTLGLSGNLTANIMTDLTEDGTNGLNQWTEAGSGNYTVTIQPGEAVVKSISGSYASGLVRLNGADRVTIDGNYNGSGKYLSFSNTNNGTSGAVIWLQSASATNGATNNTIKNCILTGNAPTTTLACIVSSSGVTIGGVAEAQNINNTYKNNTIARSFYGIAVVGPTGNETGLLITENSIGSTVAGDKIGLVGIGLYQQSGIVSKNVVFGVTTSTTYTTSGILVSGTADGILIKENKIGDVKNTNATGYGSNGIQLNSSSTAANVTVVNNFIYDISAVGYSLAGVADNGYGIIAVTGGGYNIYYNSINLGTNQSSLTGLPSAVNITSGITTPGSIDLRNNIIANSQTYGTARYAIYCAAAANVFSKIDYNDYYTTGPALGYLGSARTDTAAWRAATGQDAKSISGDPKFIGPTNLHINTALISPVDNAGVELETVLTDIDGDLRNNPPDIGADEFMQTGPTTFAPTVLGCPGSIIVIPVTVNNFNNIGTISLTLDFDPAVLTFKKMTSTTIPSPGWTVDFSAASGRFIVGGYGPGFSLPNGSVLFNLTFVYHGGTCSLNWYDGDGSSCEYADATTHEALLDTPQSTYYINGSVAKQKTLSLSLFLEGLYDGGGLMHKAQNGIGDQFLADTADLITVELHNPSSYYDPPVFADNFVKLTPDGHATVCIPEIYNGTYYVTIKHRNSLETVTAVPLSFAGNSISYSFDVASKAYGSNMAVFIDGAVALFAADENQDGLVDGSDLADIENLVPTAPSGYIKEDINGDGLIDGSDLSMAGNNADAAISMMAP